MSECGLFFLRGLFFLLGLWLGARIMALIMALASQEHRSIWPISPSIMRALAAVYGRINAALNKGGE